jgi:hypothetical protein
MRSAPIAIAIGALLFAGCGMRSNVPVAPMQPEMISPDIACPVAGQTYAKGKSSTVAVAKTALGGASLHLRLEVVFNNLDKPGAPVHLNPKLVTCGSANGKKPLGTLQDNGGGTDSNCHNGKCTVTVTYAMTYKAPNRIWRYDVVRLVPSNPKPPYGPLSAARIEVKRL